jgi:hypothetical protein
MSSAASGSKTDGGKNQQIRMIEKEKRGQQPPED